jgi:hypothetical protein
MDGKPSYLPSRSQDGGRGWLSATQPSPSAVSSSTRRTLRAHLPSDGLKCARARQEHGRRARLSGRVELFLRTQSRSCKIESPSLDATTHPIFACVTVSLGFSAGIPSGLSEAKWHISSDMAVQVRKFPPVLAARRRAWEGRQSGNSNKESCVPTRRMRGC